MVSHKVVPPIIGAHQGTPNLSNYLFYDLYLHV